jgi:hypothetical protein
MAKSKATFLEFGPKDGLYFEYNPPAGTSPTLVFVNALTGSTGGWQAAVAPRCREPARLADSLIDFAKEFDGHVE